MLQMIATLLLDGPPVRWNLRDGTDSAGNPFVVAETADKVIGITAQDIRALSFFAASLASAIRQHIETTQITERDPIGL